MHSDEVLEHQWLSSLNGSVSNISSNVVIVEKSQKAVANMVKMSNSSELKRAGSMAMVFGFQPRQAVEMRAIFQSFDTDASGGLTFGKLHTVLFVQDQSCCS
jgi:hypothetical protein